MPRTEEFTDVVAGTPEQLFSAVKNPHEWGPKLVSHVFPDGTRHEGDGTAGSVYHFDIHQDHHHVLGGSSKMKIVMQDYDPSTLSYVVDYQGDPRYEHLKFHVRFVPGPSPQTTAVKWLLDYSPFDANTPPPNDLLALNLPQDIFKDLAAHLESTESEKQ